MWISAVACLAWLLDLALPQSCVACGRSGFQLCPACRESLPRLGGPLCFRCGAPTAWPVSRCRECAGRRLAFASARAAVAYDENVRRVVAAWKEGGLRPFSALAADLIVEGVPRPRVAALAYVPADTDRSLWRGHRPAERLARELAARWELPVAALVARTRPLPRQRGLPPAARRRNVSGAFRPSAPAPRAVALVDDVYTTGATVAAAASALRKGGARQVEIVTFARVVR